MTLNTKKAVTIAICVLLFFVILVHQLIYFGKFIELNDLLHHEGLAFILFSFAVGLGLGEIFE